MMSKADAADVLARMKAETPENAQVAVIKTALKLGRLGPEAVELYRARLKELKADT